MKVLIAGAGIGGLTAALCLNKAGYDVRVFEQSTQLAEVGAGLQCGANALRVFEYLGLQEEIERIAVDPDRAEFKHYQTGETLYAMQWGKEYLDKYGVPYLHVHRHDLHSILATAFNQKQYNGISLNSKITSFTESEDSVTISLQNGERVKGDVLVGADGIRSAIRKQLIGESNPKFTGNVAWRGVIPVEKLPANFMDKIVSNFIGPRKHMVIYYLRKQQLVNFVGVVENKTWQDDSWVVKSPWEELQEDFAGWHPTVEAVVNAVDKDQCYRWALYNHQPFTNWSSKRVTLLGDAAHATLPFMASGAAMAIEDARILERSLSEVDNVEQALQLYQNNRFARTTKIQKMSTQAGKLYHIPNQQLLRMAFAGLRLMGGKREAFLAEYDANTVELMNSVSFT